MFLNFTWEINKWNEMKWKSFVLKKEKEVTDSSMYSRQMRNTNLGNSLIAYLYDSSKSKLCYFSLCLLP